MERWTRKITDGMTQIQKRVENLLETDASQTAEVGTLEFQASREPGMIRALALGLPDDHVDRAIVIFSRLSALFEAGVLLENRDGAWTPHAIFQKGHARPLRTEKKPAMTLPTINPLSALRSPSAPLLKKLALTELDRDGRCQAILLKPVPDFAFLLLTNLPDLWLKEHLENTVNAVADGFSS